MLEEYQTARREHEWRFGMLIPSRIGKVLHETRTRLGLPEMPSLPSFVSKLISVHIHKIDVGHIVEFELVPIKMDTFPTQFKRGKVPTQDEVCNAGFLYNADVIVDQIPLYHLCTPGDQNHLDKFWLTRIPRKLRTELVRPAGHTQRVVGWGIHVNEGLNWVPILASLLFLLILFGLVVVLYAMATSDNSSAFGLGAYLVAVLTLYMTFQYFSWKEA
ncbi:hypothetical protein GGR54DRAFT_150172 [Hypoxylon sp. NC1633]|nr:hypothetical protein GGR54DRAFT_150172 [Hypoxylon sp. NC1633]